MRLLRFFQMSSASKHFSLRSPRLAISAIALALAGNAMAVSPVSAAIAGMGGSLQTQIRETGPLVEVVVRRGGVAQRTTVVGPRGGVANRTVVRRNAVVRPGVVRTGVVRPGVVRPDVVRPGRWVRPARYYWAPGGAIAAGAAIGFVTAAAAVAWAGAPPADGYCWYYTDPSQTQGFWDVCP
jgi:hypothetical protein